MHARYRIEQILGQGGMGTISRAYDRLTDTHVAIKQLTLALEEWDAVHTHPLRAALAAEFRLLATLRHPHIVSVLDYGFLQNTAFYTMELLNAAPTLTTAAQGQPLAHQLALIAQLLQTLEYLRRHRVVHRDLKPENVLVQAGQVKVLDFGLAVMEGHVSDGMGTLFYMAPEVLQHQKATHASDLFAVGVLAYEVLAGRRPFEATGPTELTQVICTVEPDYTALNAPPDLQPIIARLLAKDPAERFTTAAEAITALMVASGQALPLETHATRASFIQAAHFVGRAEERQQLEQALTNACQGCGSAWLIGGESGVGKTRLLEEIHAQALIQGALVWQGQAVNPGGQPAHMWRGILRWLALFAAPSDLEAGVLKPFVPDLEVLLERVVSEAPALEGINTQTRFYATLVALLRRVLAQQPIVVLLEDLHWASALSLEALAWVTRVVTEQPLLILATYCEDERPTLPNELPSLTPLSLKRLTQPDIVALTSAILGQSAAHLPQLITFLQQQTEGNAFFLVEVLRTLAEEAGLLSQVAQMPLPTQVLTQRMHQMVQRRLQRITPADYALLELAALSGRQLDLPLLRYLAPHLELPAWLNRCAEAAVLEPQGDIWLFAHDQLRQGVVGGLALTRQPALHLAIATGIENVYARDLAPHLNRLVHHYTHTEHWAKQRYYLECAGDQAMQVSTFSEALAFYQQAQALATIGNSALTLKRALAHYHLSDYPAAYAHIQTALATAPDALARAAALALRGEIESETGHYAQARITLDEALPLAREAADRGSNPAVLARVLYGLGDVNWRQGHLETARACVEESLNLARALGDTTRLIFALNRLGAVYSQTDPTQAQHLYEEALALAIAVGNRERALVALNNLGEIARVQGDMVAARDFYQQALASAQEIGLRVYVAGQFINIACTDIQLGNFAAARTGLRAGLALERELGMLPGLLWALIFFAELAYAEGQIAQGLRLYGLVQQHPAINHEHQHHLTRTLAQWGVMPEVANAELAQGATLDFEQTVTDLLRE